MESEKQTDNSKPWLWKKGQSGNPKGRPKGKTMKEYAREYLACMTDEEREDFFEGIDKHKIWEMAEGKAESKTDITSGGKPIIQIPGVVAERFKIDDNSNEETGGVSS